MCRSKTVLLSSEWVLPGYWAVHWKKWNILVAKSDFTFNFPYINFKTSRDFFFYFFLKLLLWFIESTNTHFTQYRYYWSNAVEKRSYCLFFFRAIVVLFWRVSTVKSSSEDYSGRRQRPKTGYCKAIERIHSATRKQTGQ